jgi:hypothetical protein
VRIHRAKPLTDLVTQFSLATSHLRLLGGLHL